MNAAGITMKIVITILIHFGGKIMLMYWVIKSECLYECIRCENCLTVLICRNVRTAATVIVAI